MDFYDLLSRIIEVGPLISGLGSSGPCFLEVKNNLFPWFPYLKTLYRSLASADALLPTVSQVNYSVWLKPSSYGAASVEKVADYCGDSYFASRVSWSQYRVLILYNWHASYLLVLLKQSIHIAHHNCHWLVR